MFKTPDNTLEIVKAMENNLQTEYVRPEIENNTLISEAISHLSQASILFNEINKSTEANILNNFIKEAKKKRSKSPEMRKFYEWLGFKSKDLNFSIDKKIPLEEISTGRFEEEKPGIQNRELLEYQNPSIPKEFPNIEAVKALAQNEWQLPLEELAKKIDLPDIEELKDQLSPYFEISKATSGSRPWVKLTQEGIKALFHHADDNYAFDIEEPDAENIRNEIEAYDWDPRADRNNKREELIQTLRQLKDNKEFNEKTKTLFNLTLKFIIGSAEAEIENDEDRATGRLKAAESLLGKLQEVLYE